MCYTLKNKTSDSNYYINTNNTMLYIHDKIDDCIEKFTSDTWSSMDLEVIEPKENKSIDVNLNTIVNKGNDFIIPCQIISSTIKPSGYFKEENKYKIKTHYLNVFLGSKTFLESKKQNKYQNKHVIELLEKETPTINLLLRNLFHNENDEIIVNFINWLNVVSFKDTNQDIIFSFIGTNEQNQGQGSGKGVLIQLLNKMFSGLVVSVSNNTYQKNFNSNLMNKKIVVFDEVHYNKLKYETIKDITGNPIFRIEFKGKEPLESKNVSSWLMFSNEWDLCNKITIEDRRVFIIRPNPRNESLKRVIQNKFDGDFKKFENNLHNEIENFIHIISSVEGKVLSPIQLKSNRHKNYFKDRGNISVLEISQIYKTLTNKQFKKKLFDILDIISKINTQYSENIKEYKKCIDKGFINFKIFKSIFQYLQGNEYIPNNKKLNLEWEILKENLLKNGFELIHIDTKKTKVFERYKDTICIKREIYNLDKRKISSTLRTIFGKKILKHDIEIEDVKIEF